MWTVPTAFYNYQPGGGGPGFFLIDNYNGTGIITGHVADSGSNWLNAIVDQIFSDPNSSVLTGGTLRTKTPNWWFGTISDVVPPSADYYVEAVCHFDTPASTNGNIIIAGRWNESGFGTGYYVICWRNSAGNIQGFLRRRNGGGANDDSWGFPAGIAVGDDFTVRLSMIGTAIDVIVDGTTRISRTEANVSQVGTIAIHLDTNGASDESHVYMASIVAYG